MPLMVLPSDHIKAHDDIRLWQEAIGFIGPFNQANMIIHRLNEAKFVNFASLCQTV